MPNLMHNQHWKRIKIRLLILIPVVLGMLAAVATVTLAATSSLDIFKVNDPVGDTFGHSPPRHDVTQFTAMTNGSVLSLTVVFSGTVHNPNSSTNAVLGFIDLDTDQDKTTGKVSNVTSNCPYPSSNLGMDYYIDLSQYVSG